MPRRRHRPLSHHFQSAAMAAARRTLPLASLTTPCTALIKNSPGPLPRGHLGKVKLEELDEQRRGPAGGC
ncbi:hypothetical protein PtB15_15B223 [Puccinia triticina]|nr:hypothetical protein PtB15_15B223 [Puccinia triticina]